MEIRLNCNKRYVPSFHTINANKRYKVKNKYATLKYIKGEESCAICFKVCVGGARRMEIFNVPTKMEFSQ